MTIVLVILAVLILLAVLFLIYRVNQVGNTILSAMMDGYNSVVNHFIALEKNVTAQVNSVTTVIGSQQEEVVKLTNKVEESNSYCKAGVDSLKHTVLTLNDRLTAPIDKINDTHNRIKTLGKGITSADEFRDIIGNVVPDIVGNVVGDIARAAVDDTVNRLTKKPKTTKKVTKEPVVEVKA